MRLVAPACARSPERPVTPLRPAAKLTAVPAPFEGEPQMTQAREKVRQATRGIRLLQTWSDR